MARLLGVVGLLLVVFGRPAQAHELLVDDVRFWVDAERQRLHALVRFDPELTRNLDDRLQESVAKARVVAFLKEHISVRLNHAPCSLDYTVRELYVRGGAVPGDIVVAECRFNGSPQTLQVRIGEPFERLVITVQRLNKLGTTDSHSLLLTGGEQTPRFHFAEPEPPAAWRPGDSEQFAPVPSGSAAVGAPRPATLERAPLAAPPIAPDTAAVGPPGFEPEPLGRVVWRYLVLGVEHIVPLGLDHVLFVCGLVLGAGRNWRRLLIEISAFTFAHTLTLALGAFGWLIVSGNIIEPLIALSIALVGIENLWLPDAGRHRPAIVFVFGLIHGQGFASVLMDSGLAQGALVVSLLSFNIGVELGQLLVAFSISALLFATRHAGWQRRYLIAPGSLLIALTGAYWAIVRIAG